MFGLIFLFKYIGSSPKSSSAPADGTFDPDAINDAGLFFAAQTIQNACGTQAILSVILNQDDLDQSKPPDSGGNRIDIGPTLHEFKSFTTGFPPDLLGEALSNSAPIRTAHNSFARSSPFADETQREVTGTEDVYHFIGYVPHHGVLYELDGLQPNPISHGPCSHDEFPEKIIPVLQRRIDRYPMGEIHFNLMAVCRDLRVRAQEAGDTEGLAREARKRRGWEWENGLRKHNFVGFVGEVLKGVVGQKVREGKYGEWVDTAREATKKRAESQRAKGEQN